MEATMTTPETTYEPDPNCSIETDETSFTAIKVIPASEAPKAREKAYNRFERDLGRARACADTRRENAAWIALRDIERLDRARESMHRWWGVPHAGGPAR